MKLNVIAVLSLLVLIKAEPLQSKLEKLRSSTFGQTILETIQMQLEGENPVQNLVDMLQNIDLQLEAEQRRDDDNHNHFQTNCENDMNALDGVIGESNTQSKLLKTQLDQQQPQKTAKVVSLERKNSELADLKAELEKQEDRRTNEKSRYEKTLDDLEASLFAVNEAKKMFNDFLDILQKNKRVFSGSFMEQKASYDQEENSSFTQLSHNINKLKHNIKQEGIKSSLQALAQVSSQISLNAPADDHEVLCKKVLAIIAQIDQFIQKQRMNEDQSEQSRNEAFLSLQTMFSDQIILTQSEIDANQGSIQSLTNQITSVSNEKFEYDQKLQVKGNEKEDREKECNMDLQDYTQEKNKRDGERVVLSEALDIITTQLGQLKKQMLEK